MLIALFTIAREANKDPELYDQLDEQISCEVSRMTATCVVELHGSRLLNHQEQDRTGKGQQK
ncbi:MAG: hypothetical protein H6847_00815 [Hyphomonas sp.]|nr:hypothetical protein [Hyphomonas sp.]MCB9970022.1 hypothetical protein [Hyphomonas sp.]